MVVSFISHKNLGGPMKFTRTTLLLLIIFTVSCSSNPERDFDKEFKVVDASSKAIPEWIDEPEEGDKENARKESRYFISESSHSNKRLCNRSAQARATAKIAQEIAQFIKNSYAEATQGSDDTDISQYMQEQLGQEAQSFVVGSKVVQTYWEKRRYLKELGASKNQTKYNCFALVKMKKEDLKKAVELSRKKLLENVKNPETKAKTEKVLEDIGQKFIDS
jgi:hypothetical protein